MKIYTDGDYQITATESESVINFQIQSAGKTNSFEYSGFDELGFINLIPVYAKSIKKMGANPASYVMRGGTILRRAALPAVEAAAKDYRERKEASRPAPALEAHHCERCGTKTENPTWKMGWFQGIEVGEPYCADCAKLLRIFAGGIGCDGEKF